ncbi:peptidyl-Lys metalloendopeptidase [Ceratobasidium sp. AG-Ba]|nr:peptidyl-Lys metalloendopeptidase [Ceratobasidium sp. AG-Ba]
MRIIGFGILIIQLALLAAAAPAEILDEIRVLDVDVQLRVVSLAANSIQLIFSIANSGRETYQILDTPTSILSELPRFTAQVSWDAESAIKAKRFTTLRPRDNLMATYELYDYYDFSESGSGTYTLTLPPYIELLDSSGRAFLARFSDQPKQDIQVDNPRFSVAKQKAPTYTFTSNATAYAFRQCNGRELIITAAANQSTELGNFAVQSLQPPSPWSPLATRWFGAFDSFREREIRRTYTRLNNKFATYYTYDCTCPSTFDQFFVYAYVYTDRTDIFVCPWFFNRPGIGVTSRAAILLHEATHIEVSTEDYVYTRLLCLMLAWWSPGRAYMNASSYQYYAEDLVQLRFGSMIYGVLDMGRRVIVNWLHALVAY